jgi:hypothetical protein
MMDRYFETGKAYIYIERSSARPSMPLRSENKKCLFRLIPEPVILYHRIGGLKRSYLVRLRLDRTSMLLFSEKCSRFNSMLARLSTSSAYHQQIHACSSPQSEGSRPARPPSLITARMRAATNWSDVSMHAVNIARSPASNR